METVARYIICEISDQTLHSEYPLSDISDYHVRKCSRGILLNKGKVALLNVTKENYHKLPGGGIEGTETNEEAFKREVREETGCDCEIKTDNPVTIEYRDKEKLVQISYIFVAEVIGEPKQPNFEQDEVDHGFQLEWVPLEEVESVMSKDNPKGWEGEFIHERDQKIFEFYKDRLLRGDI